MELLRCLYAEWLSVENRAEVLAALADEAVVSWENLPDDPLTAADQCRVMASLPKRPIPPCPSHPVAVILAAGRGTRMKENIRQKSLCLIDGRPALDRALETYRQFGIEHFILVVGTGYRDVLQCLGTGDPRITYLYQEEQRGTGHAARLAARYLRYVGFEGSVLVAMGDKYITPRGLETLLTAHAQTQADLTLAAASKTAWPDSGRVVLDSTGRVRAILERPDVVQRQLLKDFYTWPEDPVPCQTYRDHALRCWNRPEKLRKILSPAFWQALGEKERISKKSVSLPLAEAQLSFFLSDTLQLTPEEVETQCGQVNISVYVFKAPALYEATERLQSNNAQGELYLTDAVYDLTGNHHADAYHITAACMPGDYDVMGFNTSEELAEIERRVRDNR